MIYVIADNIGQDTYEFINGHIDQSKIIKTSLGNSGSFLYAVNFCINKFNDSENVYFSEDDYIHLDNAGSIIEEGLRFARNILLDMIILINI